MDQQYLEMYEHFKQRIRALSEAAPGPMSGFAALHRQALAAGALGAKEKELIALGIAIAVHCDACIAYHVHDALRAGATRPEIAETIGVAVLMGGGPAVMYGSEALEALAQFEARLAA